MITSTLAVARSRRLARFGEILTRDYFPRYDRYLKWIRKPLTVLLLGGLVSILCGLYLHPQGFVFAFSVAVVAITGGLWPWLSLCGIRGSLQFERLRCFEGEEIDAQVSLRNRLPWGIWGLFLRVGADKETTSDPGSDCAIAYAAGWHTSQFSWKFRPSCRGWYPAPTASMATSFPFGLVTATRSIDVEDSVLVWPRTFLVGPIPEIAFGANATGCSLSDRSGTSGEMTGVRPYRRGDLLRQVHWSQTARHGRLIIRELQSETLPRVQIVLDLDPAVHSGTGADGSREWAIRIAASFLVGWLERSAEVEVVFGQTVIAPRDPAISKRRSRSLDALALIGEEEGMDQPLAGVLASPLCREFSGLRLVITTDIGCQRLAESGVTAADLRLIVLEAAAFESNSYASQKPQLMTSVTLRPWILVNDRYLIAEAVGQVTRGKKYV